MRLRGLEPPRGCPHGDLNAACIPISPQPQWRRGSVAIASFRGPVSTAATQPEDEFVEPPRSGDVESNRWVVLVIVCLAQFMVVLDATVVNVALPSIQTDLGFSAANLQWVINAYTLVFGGFLLLGGRAGDLFGRRRLFLAGVAIFSAASLLNGLATSEALARRRPRAPGPRRRARLPRRALDHHHHLRGGRGAHEGARRLERDRGRRRRLRPAARRHPHRPAELGVDLLRQRADRPRHRGARDPLRAGVARAEPPRQRRPARRGQRHRGPRRARVRDRQGGGLRLGLREDARPRSPSRPRS